MRGPSAVIAVDLSHRSLTMIGIDRRAGHGPRTVGVCRWFAPSISRSGHGIAARQYAVQTSGSVKGSSRSTVIDAGIAARTPCIRPRCSGQSHPRESRQGRETDNAATGAGHRGPRAAAPVGTRVIEDPYESRRGRTRLHGTLRGAVWPETVPMPVRVRSPPWRDHPSSRRDDREDRGQEPIVRRAHGPSRRCLIYQRRPSLTPLAAGDRSTRPALIRASRWNRTVSTCTPRRPAMVSTLNGVTEARTTANTMSRRRPGASGRRSRSRGCHADRDGFATGCRCTTMSASNTTLTLEEYD